MAKASRQPTRKIMAGRKFSRPLAWLYTRSATYTSAPRLSVMAFKVQAKVGIRMAGTMALKPSGDTGHAVVEIQDTAHLVQDQGDQKAEEASKGQSQGCVALRKGSHKIHAGEKNPPVYSIPITQQIIKEIIGIEVHDRSPEITDGSDSSA